MCGWVLTWLFVVRDIVVLMEKVAFSLREKKVLQCCFSIFRQLRFFRGAKDDLSNSRQRQQTPEPVAFRSRSLIDALVQLDPDRLDRQGHSKTKIG